MRHAVGSYAEDNSGTVKSEGDDQGLPESPIYSNFSKHLWTSHTRKRRVGLQSEFREKAVDPVQPLVKALPTATSLSGKKPDG